VSLGLIVIFYLNTQLTRSFHVGRGFFFFFGGPTTPVKKKKNTVGGRTNPLGHGGGLATSRPAGLVGPSYPHGLRGGQPPLVGWIGHPLFFFFLFFFIFIFIL
jgi:hypothetical protein